MTTVEGQKIKGGGHIMYHRQQEGQHSLTEQHAANFRLLANQ